MRLLHSARELLIQDVLVTACGICVVTTTVWFVCSLVPCDTVTTLYYTNVRFRYERYSRTRIKVFSPHFVVRWNVRSRRATFPLLTSVATRLCMVEVVLSSIDTANEGS